MKKIILLCITGGLLLTAAACHNYENVNITSENIDFVKGFDNGDILAFLCISVSNFTAH